MTKMNVWKLLALATVVLYVGCAATKPHTNAGTAGEAKISGTGDASSGAGTGEGATDPVSGGTGNATSGAGTGSGGSTK
ncbi:MAG: hypothetical protein CTY33_04670 [Methylotenera sp.]|nr:MAG: hypothetical protein CTY33_04670 [Methylotenera sp.]